MVALNYQTPDVAMAINSAMFEQWNNIGYMLKPRALYDETSPFFGQFNPLSKDSNNVAALILQITVISGQYVCASHYNVNPVLEIEIIGVQADCAKEKSKPVVKNSVNPIWNHSTTFRITCPELSFLRIAVCDSMANNKCMTQRVVPLSCLRPGYRHLPLRTISNQPLEQSTLFIQSRFEQEEIIHLHDEDVNTITMEPDFSYQNLKAENEYIKPVAILRRQIFVIKIIGLFFDDTPTIVRIDKSETKVKDVIQAALFNANKINESADDYVLFEETVASHCSPSPVADCNPSTSLSAMDQSVNDNIPTQRVLPLNEPILDSVACWNGISRRFYLRKKNNESGRAWITSIINKGAISNAASPVFGQNRKGIASDSSVGSSNATSVIIDTSAISNSGSPFRGLSSRGSQKGMKSHSSSQIHGRSLDVEQASGIDYLEPNVRGIHPRARSMGETFLVCVYISKEQYIFLRSSLYNNAADVIKQIFVKTQRCFDDEADYVLLEELKDQESLSKPAENKTFYRILDSDENVWKAQQRWRSRTGRFMLEKRELALIYERQNPKSDTNKSIRKISLSNMRSINLTRRISRLGKTLTLDGATKKDT